MQILEYEFHEADRPGWHFSKAQFRKINLIVGDSGTGKTRFLNTLFNLGKASVSNTFDKSGHWQIRFLANGNTYEWSITALKEKTQVRIVSEQLNKIEHDGTIVEIVDRNSDRFMFKGNKSLKFSDTISSISLLKEEDALAPIYKAFSNIRRRRPQDEDPSTSLYQLLPTNDANLMEIAKDLEKLAHADLSINVKLYLLKKFGLNHFNQIIKFYKSVFPFIIDIDVKDMRELHKDVLTPGPAPVFCIKEQNMDKWIEYGDLSSGMRKVLDILTDIYGATNDWVYLIDEYENSLGINAINFLPTLLESYGAGSQFIITSHHPYIINHIPIENWLVFHRIGSEVKIRAGKSYEEQFKLSKQQAFIQLMNDPFYREGVE